VTFSVNPKALDGLPTNLDRRTDDLRQATSYLLANTALHDSSGLADAFDVHARVIAGIKAFLDSTAAAFPVPDATRVRAAITAYSSADARAVARADAATPSVPAGLPAMPPITATERGYGPSIFDDHVHPASALVRPANHYGDIPYQPSWFDLLSPSSIARDVIWKLTSTLASAGLLDRAYDPFESLVEPFVGDWAGLLRCAEVFDHLGALLAAASTAVLDANNATHLVWTGNVAGMAEVNLGAFADRLTSGVEPLGSIAMSYREVAHGVQDNASLAEMMITNMVDDAIDGGLDTATFGLAGVYEFSNTVRNFIKTLLAAVRIGANVVDLVSAGFAASNDAANRLGVLLSVSSMPNQQLPVPPIPWPVPPYAKAAVPRPSG
jgi:hypothetical protein